MCKPNEKSKARPGEGVEAVVPTGLFKEGLQWRVDLHIMTGITLIPWCMFILRNTRRIDLGYLHRILFLSFMAVVNTILAIPEWLWYGRRISQQTLHPEPAIILGHPRTGTTHIHNMLSLDPRFAYLNTFMAGFPSSYLWLERFRSLATPMLTETRPMDNMAMDWDLPAEDEIVANVLSGGISPYMPCMFLRDYADFFHMYTLKGAPEAAKAWLSAWTSMLRKVTFKYALRTPEPNPKPLLLKSPTHGSKVSAMMQLFPKAKFIFIHRHPIEVFQSMCVLIDRYYRLTAFQAMPEASAVSFILDQYELIHAEYLAARADIPAGALVELSFSQLDSDALRSMERVYDAFGWEGFDRVRPKYEAYLSQLRAFKKNDHPRLPRAVVDLIVKRWGHTFNEFGYSLDDIQKYIAD